jgi:hypothetical protein
VVNLWEEVTRARAAFVMAEARTARVEEIAHERAILLATAHEANNKAAQRVSSLEDELVAVHRARGMAEEKLPSLAAKVAVADQQQVGVEE